MLKRMIAPIVIGVAGVAVLMALGIWQTQRLVWKEGVLAEIEARIAAAPVALPETADPVRDRYLPVTADGEIGDDNIFHNFKKNLYQGHRRWNTGYETAGAGNRGTEDLLLNIWMVY